MYKELLLISIGIIIGFISHYYIIKSKIGNIYEIDHLRQNNKRNSNSNIDNDITAKMKAKEPKKRKRKRILKNLLTKNK